MFRVANARESHIADSAMNVAVIIEEISPEGDKMQRIFDLDLVRSYSPVFFMSWTAMHIIDEKSPLYNLNSQDMNEKNVRIVISLTGIDDWTSQHIHVNYAYKFSDIIFNKKFVDILTSNNDQISMDYALFHKTK